jgi:hypothetical protein
MKEEFACGLHLNPDDDIASSIPGSFYMALGNIIRIEHQRAAVVPGNLPEGGYDESERAPESVIAIAAESSGTSGWNKTA